MRPIHLDVDSSCWCPRCIEYFNHCKQQISIRDRLEIIGGLFTKQIMYRCHSRSHIFLISSLRKHKHQTQYKINEYSCPDCKKEEKEMLKRQAQEEEERMGKILEEKQRILFEKAVEDMNKREQMYTQ